MELGTEEYANWLNEYRQRIFISAGTVEMWKECYMVKRTPEKQEQAKKKYIRDTARHGHNILSGMYTKHKVAYYKKLEVWNTFSKSKNASQLNPDTLREIRKFL